MVCLKGNKSMTCEVKYNEGLSESSFWKKKKKVESELLQANRSWWAGLRERRLTEHRYSPRLEHETFFLMPGFHYEAERWGDQFVIDSKSFAERHSPFFGRQPCENQAKQMKLTFPASAARTASHHEVPPCQVLMGGGGEKSGGSAERARGQNGLFKR